MTIDSRSSFKVLGEMTIDSRSSFKGINPFSEIQSVIFYLLFIDQS